MRILITGASGQLGAYLINRIVDKGGEVVAWSHSTEGERSGILLRPVDLTDAPPALPFIRFTRLSGMGQQIERQITRMKLRLPHCAEVDSAHQQIAMVASGFGWTITSPVCLAAEPELLGGLRLEPMPRGRFARHVQVVARSGELGDIPQQIAELSTQHLSTVTFPPLIAKYPWLKEQIAWPFESTQKLG